MSSDTSEQARINLGRIATREGRYDEAEQHFGQVLRESSDNDAALLGQAIVMLKQHRYDEATRIGLQLVPHEGLALLTFPRC